MRSTDDPLQNLKVASPCPADWNQMYGDERTRFCGECRLNVYNISGMTRVEAERLIASSEGRLCVRFYRRADGTVLTRDCPVGLAAVRRRVARVATALAGFLFGALTGTGATLALRDDSTAAVGRYEHTMGDVVSPDAYPRDEPVTVVTGVVAPEMVMGRPAMPPQPASRPKAVRRGGAR